MRKIEPADRAKWDLWIKHAEERGDPGEAHGLRDSFAEWEKEQGLTRERLVCGVCGSATLTPTASGRARFHRRYDDWNTPTWDTARRLRDDIKTLQAELDRVLDRFDQETAVGSS